MSRLVIPTNSEAQNVVEGLYKDLERRIIASPPGLCPVDLTAAFLKMCHAQTCGKCVPCRIGLAQLSNLLEDILNGKGTMKHLTMLEETARVIESTADCAIGYTAAQMVLKGLDGFKEDFMEHILHNRCRSNLDQPVPCVALCPAGVDIPGYIALTGEGRYADAVRLIRKDNPFPTACALVCEHPCESRCRRNMLDNSINIRGIKRVAVDMAGYVPAPVCPTSTGKRIAIIGGGPSGLSAAYYLQLMGHQTTVFEKRKKLGGMLLYGIPSYRLPRERLQDDINVILETGVEVRLETSVGNDPGQLSLDELRKEYDAIYIAIGAHSDKKIGIEGEDAGGVISAVEFLRAIGDGKYPDLTGKKVCVIGGGNVAMDVARSSVRLGADKVAVAYRRRKADMTALPEEVESAMAEGVEIMELYAPERIEADEDGQVKALWVSQQMPGEIRGGRPSPKAIGTDSIPVECDIVIAAVGQGIESRYFVEQGIDAKWGIIHRHAGYFPDHPGSVQSLPEYANIDQYLGYRRNQICGTVLRVDRANVTESRYFVEQRIDAKWGIIQATGWTSIQNMPGIFAGGDCATGPATVIRAIAAGKVAAANIDQYLGYNHEITCDVKIPEPDLSDRTPCGRVNLTERPAGERKCDFTLTECGMSLKEAGQEARRCLRCDHFGYGNFKGGRTTSW